MTAANRKRCWLLRMTRLAPDSLSDLGDAAIVAVAVIAFVTVAVLRLSGALT